MTSQYHFFADAALIDRLGRELVARQETALIELVKNAYDADATRVDISIHPGHRLTVADDGTGMAKTDLVSGFLRLATDEKVRVPVSPRFGRQRAGRKGIGRFAAQRLGKQLRLSTWTSEAEPGHQLFVDWRAFKPNLRLDDVPVTVEEIEPRKSGTTLEIMNLSDFWSTAQLQRCWRGVMNLQQPFPIAPEQSKQDHDPGFTVQIVSGGKEFADDHVVVDLNTEVFRHAHASIDLEVDFEGRARWRLQNNSFGENREWAVIHHNHRDTNEVPAYSSLRDIRMRAYYYILDRALLPSSVYTRLREVLRVQGGIRLYRNGFRVVPYGSPGDDWLSLDETYAQRGMVLAPIRNLNFFGFVEVNDPTGQHFEENTSREGLLETEAFENLKGLVSSTIVTAVRTIAEGRGRKPQAGEKRRDDGTEPLQVLREAERRLRDVASQGLGEEEGLGDSRASGPKTSPQTVTELADLLRKSGDAIERKEAELADESTILRLLATLGLTAAEFSHETGMTFEAVQISFRNVFDIARKVKKDDPDFQGDVERADSMVRRLVGLTTYLSSVASARSVRVLAPISVSAEVEKFRDGVIRHAGRQEIDLKVDIPPIDPLYTVPIHEADVATVLLNFYSNSLKAMRRVDAERCILLTAKRENRDYIVVEFSDTGDGIPEMRKNRIFDLFFSTTVGAPTSAQPDQLVTGSGLGLWIVRQVIENIGGGVKVIEPPEDFATCIQARFPAERRIDER